MGLFEYPFTLISLLLPSPSASHHHTTMSRSAADATRFTATGPYASSKPSAAPYKLPGFLANSDSKPQNNGSGGNRQETPKEKVERLRAQARAARIAQSTSRLDTLVDFGRRFANKAHKGMVYTLITASGTLPILNSLWTRIRVCGSCSSCVR